MAEDTTNGVTLISEQLGAVYGVIGWVGMTNMPTPDAYAASFARSCNYENLRVLGTRPTQPAPGFQQATIYEWTYTFRGMPCRGIMILNFSSNGASTTAYAQHAEVRSDRFDAIAPTLMKLTASFAGNSANTFCMADSFRATRPLGNYGIGDWHPTSTAMSDRTSPHISEGIRDVQTLHDDDGNTFEAPISAYDPTVGGYRNPNDPTQILHTGPADDPE